jgi:putative chitinase
MLNADQLAKLHISADWVDPLNETFERFGIVTRNQKAVFIGQASHESGNFKLLEENLNYKAATLMRIWPKRFPTLEKANEYAGNPKKIANSVYSSRMGNRDEASGDGWRFRGRGIFQLTGHSNVFHAGKALGVDFVKDPDLIATPKYAALTAGWFWSTHNLNSPADALDHAKVTRIINGGQIGLEHRIRETQQALAVLA